jgi:uncharacterized membrane protein YjgN (DUF898 family)
VSTPPPEGPPGPPPPNPYGGVPYGAYAVQDHPQAMMALVLGILGLVVCGVVAPFAWVVGGRAVAEIDASGGQLGGRSTANTGRILGIVGTVFLGLGLLALVGILIIFVGVASTSP